MSSLFKCRRCGRILIEEECDSHKCKIQINGKIKVIEADSWIEGKHPDTGDDLISAKALDGTTIWIVKRTLRPSDKVPYETATKRNVTGEKPNDDVPKPTSIKFIY